MIKKIVCLIVSFFICTSTLFAQTSSASKSLIKESQLSQYMQPHFLVDSIEKLSEYIVQLRLQAKELRKAGLWKKKSTDENQRIEIKTNFWFDFISPRLSFFSNRMALYLSVLLLVILIALSCNESGSDSRKKQARQFLEEQMSQRSQSNSVQTLIQRKSKNNSGADFSSEENTQTKILVFKFLSELASEWKRSSNDKFVRWASLLEELIKADDLVDTGDAAYAALFFQSRDANGRVMKDQQGYPYFRLGLRYDIFYYGLEMVNSIAVSTDPTQVKFKELGVLMRQMMKGMIIKELEGLEYLRKNPSHFDILDLSSEVAEYYLGDLIDQPIPQMIDNLPPELLSNRAFSESIKVFLAATMRGEAEGYVGFYQFLEAEGLTIENIGRGYQLVQSASTLGSPGNHFEKWADFLNTIMALYDFYLEYQGEVDPVWQSMIEFLNSSMGAFPYNNKFRALVILIEDREGSYPDYRTNESGPQFFFDPLRLPSEDYLSEFRDNSYFGASLGGFIDKLERGGFSDTTILNQYPAEIRFVTTDYKDPFAAKLVVKFKKAA